MSPFVDSTLWTVNGTTPPVEHQVNPDNFIAVSNRTVCFGSLASDYQNRPAIHCADKTGIYPFKPPSEGEVISYTFFASNNTLWFKASAIESWEDGLLIYSLAPETMNVTLHSFKVNFAKPCSHDKVLRKQSIVAFFLTALPVTLASAAIWRSQNIPSMAVTTYAGLSAIYITILNVLRPQIHDERPFQWWFAVSSFIWLILLSYFNLLLSTSPRKRAPLRWGIVVGGLAFLSTAALLPMQKDRMIDWILLNFLVFIPLLVLGAANSNWFLQSLGAIGFLVDAWRLAYFVGDKIGGDARVPVMFLVFSMTGLLMGILGFQVNQYQEYIAHFASMVVEKVNEAIVEPTNQGIQVISEETNEEHSVTDLLLTENEAA